MRRTLLVSVVLALLAAALAVFAPAALVGAPLAELSGGRLALTEPEAGSDSASVRTQAIWDGEAYVLNLSLIHI